LRIYLGVIIATNLTWEFLHLPLYTIWTTGTLGEQVFAAVHCTGGDILIALASLTLALVLAGERGWATVTALAISLGASYPIGLSPILPWYCPVGYEARLAQKTVSHVRLRLEVKRKN
jgi:hypothetical protein